MSLENPDSQQPSEMGKSKYLKERRSLWSSPFCLLIFPSSIIGAAFKSRGVREKGGKSLPLALLPILLSHNLEGRVEGVWIGELVSYGILRKEISGLFFTCELLLYEPLATPNWQPGIIGGGVLPKQHLVYKIAEKYPPAEWARQTLKGWSGFPTSPPHPP